MQDLNKFKNEMNLSGKNVYVGHRYVPKIFGDWDNTQLYEPLSIVQYQGASYTSRQYVPTGVDITNEEFWVLTGNYNAQVEQYRQDVLTYRDETQEVSDKYDNIESTQEINTAAISSLGISVKDFGAKGDGVTDDTQAIQNAIDSLDTGNIEITTNGQIKNIYFPSGVYMLSDSIIIDKHDVHLIGLGNAVLMATPDFDSNSLSGLIHVGKDANTHGFYIENITFTAKGASPFNDYNIERYGNYGSYNFNTSVLGLHLDNAHYYQVDKCKFTGLKLGIWLSGAYAGEINHINCRYNNRHVLINGMNSRNTNQVTFNNGYFNSGAMNGAIAVIGANRITFNDVDIERNNRTAILLRGTDFTTFNNAYFELNAWKRNSGDDEIFYQDSIYTTDIGMSDSLESGLNNFTIVEEYNRGLEFNNTLFAMIPSDGEGFVYSDNTQYGLKFDRCRFQSNETNFSNHIVSKQTTNSVTGSTGQEITLLNCRVRTPWKTCNSPRVRVINTSDFSSGVGDFYDEYWVNLETGNDNLRNTYDNTETNPIKNLAGLLRGLPKNANNRITINIEGTQSTSEFLNLDFEAPSKILFKGGTLQGASYIPPRGGNIIFEGTTFNKALISHLLKAGSGVVVFDNCTLNADSALGVLRDNSNNVINYQFKTCNIHSLNNSSSTAFIEVKANNDIWLKDCITTGLASVFDFGKLTYNTNIVVNKKESGFSSVTKLEEITE